MRRLLLPLLVVTVLMAAVGATSAEPVKKPLGGGDGGSMMGTITQPFGSTPRSVYFMAGGTLADGSGHILYVYDDPVTPRYFAFEVVKFHKIGANQAACVGVLSATDDDYYIDQGFVGNSWMVLWVEDRGNAHDTLHWRWKFVGIPPDSWLTDWIVPTDDGPAPVETRPITTGSIVVQ